MTRWVLADYGEVSSDLYLLRPSWNWRISLDSRRTSFRHRYWKFRPLYDLGQSDRAYWSAVLGHELQAEPQLVGAMVRVDAVIAAGFGWHSGRDAAGRGGC
jgi:hypothetical protein